MTTPRATLPDATYEIDHDAEPVDQGELIGAMARLLVEIDAGGREGEES